MYSVQKKTSRIERRKREENKNDENRTYNGADGTGEWR